jgi:hypothetical protein
MHHAEREGAGQHLVRPVDVGLAVKQQPHHLDVTAVRGQEEPREAILPRAVVRRVAAGAGEGWGKESGTWRGGKMSGAGR